MAGQNTCHPSQRRDGWGTRRFAWWMRTGNDKRANAGDLPSPSTSSGQNEKPCVLEVSGGLRARVCSRVPWREDERRTRFSDLRRGEWLLRGCRGWPRGLACGRGRMRRLRAAVWTERERPGGDLSGREVEGHRVGLSAGPSAICRSSSSLRRSGPSGMFLSASSPFVR